MTLGSGEVEVLKAGAGGELMATHQWRKQAFLNDTAYPSEVATVDISEDEAQELDEEGQVVSLLLEAFPGISLQSIVSAYARANEDPNYAAELLSLETGTESSNTSGEDSDGRDYAKGQGGMFFEAAPRSLDTARHLERKDDQVEAGNGYTVRATVLRGAPGVHNHGGRPPDPNPRGSLAVRPWVAPPPACEDGDDCLPPVQDSRNGTSICSSASHSWARGSAGVPTDASSGNGITSSYYGNSKPPSPPRSVYVNSGHTLSAVCGSVSNFRQVKKSAPPKGNAKDRTSDHMPSQHRRNARVKNREDEMLFPAESPRKTKKKGGLSEETGEECSENESALKAAEDFLHSMLGDSFELRVDVVRDVLGHFAGDTEKVCVWTVMESGDVCNYSSLPLSIRVATTIVQAFETLLHMVSPSSGYEHRSDSDQRSDPLQTLIEAFPNRDPAEVLIAYQECNEDLELASNSLLQEEIQKNGESKSKLGASNLDLVLIQLHQTFPAVELSFLSEVLEACQFSYGDAVKALSDSGLVPMNEEVGTAVDHEEALQAPFETDAGSVEAGPSSVHKMNREPYTVVVARARSQSSSNKKFVKGTIKSDGESDAYDEHRQTASEHMNTMKKYFQEATAAYGGGNRALAGVLSEKGKEYKQLGREASLRASENIFNLKNQNIRNNITIDLHSQHVQESFSLLKLHLKSLSSIPSVHTLTVITGQGAHSIGGRARIKPAITKFMTTKNIPWTEPNGGCLIIKMADVRRYYTSPRSSDSSSGYESS